ncbi:DNA translocase FtsK [Blochmannia endosymbiont of Camponotus nipponensis]|uniref:DNA translocase FtsK n=1 Tax=Blochmannia endosymbiont of Camponotus nipponensis TaxID=2681986 RepID=UPI001356BC44
MIHFILIGISIILLYLIIILITFNPADPGWLQMTWNGSIHNVGGILGAKISDFLFFIFGIPAYMIPLFMLFYLWKIYARDVHITTFIFLFKLMGILVLLFVCCGLAHLTIDNFFYFSSGGIVGSVTHDFISSFEKITYPTNLILFLLIGIADVMIFFNRFFLVLLRTIKKQLFYYSYYLTSLFFCEKKQRCQINNQESCDTCSIYPLTLSTKKSNFLKNSENNLLNTHTIYDTVEKIKEFMKTFVLILKNIFIKVKCVSLVQIFSRVLNIIKSLLSRIKLYTSKKGRDYYQIKYMNNVFYKRNNYNIKTDKYDKKFSNNYNICCFEKKEQNINMSLIYDSNTVCINDKHHKRKIPVFINKNIKRNIPLFQHKEVSAVYRKSYCNDRAVIFPDVDLLTTSSSEKTTDFLELKKIAHLLESKLLEYHIKANVANIVPGPVITRFELNLSPGIKSSKISNLSRDLARVLYTTSVRVVEVISGTSYVGLEIPNKKRNTVYLGDIINSQQFKKINTPLALVLGKDISGQPFIVDLKSMPHLLVAGTTGSGKSVGINAMIISILYKATPEEVSFIMIDPKILELSIYSGIPHLLKQVITDTQEVYEVLQWCIKEMERRYKLMAMLGVRNLENYNNHLKKNHSKRFTANNVMSKYINDSSAFSDTLEKLPYIVIIIDEFSDLMITTTKKVEELVIRLTQKARAAGIHVILATQRPSVNVITGVIKANIPARVAFTVSSKIDSRTILGQSGAESLLGMGDMLYLGPNSSISTRVHGAFVEDQEIHAVVDFWKNQIVSL